MFRYVPKWCRDSSAPCQLQRPWWQHTLLQAKTVAHSPWATCLESKIITVSVTTARQYSAVMCTVTQHCFPDDDARAQSSPLCSIRCPRVCCSGAMRQKGLKINPVLKTACPQSPDPVVVDTSPRSRSSSTGQSGRFTSWCIVWSSQTKLALKVHHVTFDCTSVQDVSYFLCF